ncbi:MAG: DNA polymerase III subunit delta' [Leucothrix sp.]
MIYPWQQASWNQLSQGRQQNHMPHALLLAGPEHCGKFDFASSLAKSLLCESRDNDTQVACNRCKSCSLFEAGSHPDYTSVQLAEKKSQIVVDQIRGLNEFVYLSRSYEGSRVVIISPVERLNINAANSLLKTLEEPPAKTVLILVSSNPSALIPTIRSRCQVLHLPQPTHQQALQWLATHDLENPVEELLLAATGKPMLAKQLDEGERLATRKQLATDILKLLRGSVSLVSVAKQWEKAPKADLLDWQLQWVQAMVRGHYQAEGAPTDTISPHLYRLMRQSVSSLWELHDGLLELKSHVHTSLSPLLFTEDMLLLWQKQSLSQ